MSNVWHRTCIALYVSVHVSVCFIFQICTMACRGGMFIAGIFTVAGLGLLIAAVATVHWVDTLVDRTALAALNDAAITADLQNNPIYFTRYRGMFTTCYETDNSRSVSPCILKRRSFHYLISLLDKMSAFSQTTFSDAFSWMKTFVFW